MSINQRQFEQLSEMGIKLWQRRTTAEQSTSRNLEHQNTYLEVNLSVLSKDQCFIDIVQAFNLTLGEISQQSDHLDLGLFNWYFIATDNTDEMPLTYVNNQLITPAIELISHSVSLKRQLWQTMSQQQI